MAARLFATQVTGRVDCSGHDPRRSWRTPQRSPSEPHASLPLPGGHTSGARTADVRHCDNEPRISTPPDTPGFAVKEGSNGPRRFRTGRMGSRHHRGASRAGQPQTSRRTVYAGSTLCISLALTLNKAQHTANYSQVLRGMETQLCKI